MIIKAVCNEALYRHEYRVLAHFIIIFLLISFFVIWKGHKFKQEDHDGPILLT